MIKKYIFAVTVIVLALATIPFAGCGGGKVAQDGDLVKVHYTGTLDDGSEFDSSAGRDPLEFTIGAGQMIPGFENAVRGMKVGETITVTIPASEAYGERDEEMIIELDRSELPEGIEPVVGDELPFSSGGRTVYLTVVEVTDTTFKVDANHQLAGKDLTFRIELVELTRE